MGKGPCWKAWAGGCIWYVVVDMDCMVEYADEISRRRCDCGVRPGELHFLDAAIRVELGGKK